MNLIVLFLIILIEGAQANPLRPGGDLTHGDLSKNAFSHPGPNVNGVDKEQFFVGNSFFKKAWVAAPSSTQGRDGLGPTYNAVACASCHLLDGRGIGYLNKNQTDIVNVSLLFRLSEKVNESWQPHSDYGGQLNPFAIEGVPGEAQVKVVFKTFNGSYADGVPYEIRKPVFTFDNFSFKKFDTNTAISPRVAPHMIGLGLIEAIPEENIIALSDPDDLDGNGISGRPHWIINFETGKTQLGRFGWKASQPTLRLQNAAAFLGDIGLTTPVFKEQNCPLVQLACLQAIQGGVPEVDEDILSKVTKYTQALGVPERRGADLPEVIEGEKIFNLIGCADCHTPFQNTGDDHSLLALRAQKFYPYSDFLLHDMGADLADERPDGDATGVEWRTPPLWGIGLFLKINKHQNLLHDARARGVEEAILWHGGEAKQSRDRFVNLKSLQREYLVKFINSL